MTDNQRFKAFQQKINKMRFGHHAEIPFATRVIVHVWTDKTDSKSKHQFGFTMLPGAKAVDAGKIADQIGKDQFGLTLTDMSYTVNFCSQLDIFCQATGKKLKV